MIKRKKRILVIDYKLNNLFSIKNALDYLGYDPIISSESKMIEKVDYVVLPGIGAFPQGMKKLKSLNLVDPLKKFINSGKKFLGICLGFQMLFEQSYEFKKTRGLGIIKGSVEKLSKKKNFLRIPHIGWNKVIMKKNQNAKILNENNYFYFVHSYIAVPKKKNEIYTFTKYQNHKFCSSIKKNNIFACQFHPEKSGKAGLSLIKNFFDN
jgi:imidazole glycerol-phosphate synthase subunit HisH